MSEHARVDTVEALKSLRVALCKFADTARIGLDESEAEVRQATYWLEQEQYPFWKREVVRLREEVNRAKLELTRKEYTKRLLDSAMSLVEDRKLVSKLKYQLEEAEDKVQHCKRWMRQLEQETFAFKGGIQGLSQSVHGDVPNSLTLLDNMIMAIEDYAGVRAPASGTQRRATAELPEAPDTEETKD